MLKLFECSSSPEEFQEYCQTRIYQEIWLTALLEEISIEMDYLSSALNISPEGKESEPAIPQGSILDFIDSMSLEAIESRQIRTTPEELQQRYQKIKYYRVWLKYSLMRIQRDIKVTSEYL